MPGLDVRRYFSLSVWCLRIFNLYRQRYDSTRYVGRGEQYQAGIDWVPTSMTAYLAGGCFYNGCWGRCRIVLVAVRYAGGSGVVYRHLSGNIAGAKIEQFTLLRFLQGISLCFIGAWDTPQFRNPSKRRFVSRSPPDGERGADCSATWSAGGRGVIHVLPWEGMFVLFAALAAISFSVCNEPCLKPPRV